MSVMGSLWVEEEGMCQSQVCEDFLEELGSWGEA